MLTLRIFSIHRVSGGQNAKSETKSDFIAVRALIKLVEEHSEADWPRQPLCEEKKMCKVSCVSIEFRF